ncbi:MAG: hypothetical protein P8M26_02940 [Gammaproteobacteria bacterium]|jgi:hypothetical protein|nr:hypothetical protein [Gammaproteobacteria bacterium]
MRVKLILLVIAAAGLVACAGRTTVSGTWEETEARGERFNRLLIVTLARDSSRRRQFDSELRRRLNGNTTTLFTASSLLAPNAEITSAMVEQLVLDNNIDGVIVTRVTEQRLAQKEITSKTDSKVYRSTGQLYESIYTDNTFNFVQYDYTADIAAKDYKVPVYDLTLTTDINQTKNNKTIYRIVSVAENQTDLSEMINTLTRKIARQIKRAKLVSP